MSCYYAMVTGVLKAFLWAVSPVWPVLLPNFACQLETSQFTEAIPREGTGSDSDLLGLGSPSTGLKNRRRAAFLTESVQHR